MQWDAALFLRCIISGISVADAGFFCRGTSSRRAGDAIDGWIACGAALNEGRVLFPSDEQFGRWVGDSQLGRHSDGREIKYDDRAAAMWAAAYPEQFEEARAAGGAKGKSNVPLY